MNASKKMENFEILNAIEFIWKNELIPNWDYHWNYKN
jgi:hypothetical protein